MQKNPNDRSLNGKEREQERISVKRMTNSIKKIEFEIQINDNEVEKLGIDNEEKKMQITNLTERRDQGKRLIGGAKIIDVFPPALPPEEKTEVKKISKEEVEKLEAEKKKGGENSAGKV